MLLFHFLLGAVAVARNDVVLQRLVLLVLNAQRLPLVIHQLDAQLAIRSILLGVARLIDQLIL